MPEVKYSKVIARNNFLYVISFILLVIVQIYLKVVKGDVRIVQIIRIIIQKRGKMRHIDD